VKALEDLWPRAHGDYSGPDWEASWLDWDARLRRLRENIEEETKAEAERKRG
jgi:hypothetical protein